MAFETRLERVWELIRDAPPEILLWLFSFAALLTFLKLRRMARIRGWLPGRELLTRAVLEKWHQSFPKDIYWIRVEAEGSIENRGGHRLNVPADFFESVEEGDEVELMRIRGEKGYHLESGIYAGTGNFVLDGVIFLAEMCAIGYFWYQSLNH